MLPWLLTTASRLTANQRRSRLRTALRAALEEEDISPLPIELTEVT